MAFTLAEVLITLAIIGVVSAITIPTVITNYQKEEYTVRLKKSYNTFSKGFKQIMANDGVTKLEDTTLWSKMPKYSNNDGLGDQYITAAYSAAGFGKKFMEEFKKTFNVIGVIGVDNINEKNVVQYKTLGGQETDEDYRKNFGGGGPLSKAFSAWNNKGTIFLADGSYLYLFYFTSPIVAECNGHDCKNLKEFQQTYNTPTKFWKKVGQIIIDVNGARNPNTWGRDLFTFEIGEDGTLYPKGGIETSVGYGCSYDEILNNTCKFYWKKNNDCSTKKYAIGHTCTGRIVEEGWKMRY